MSIREAAELEALKEAGRIVHACLEEMKRQVRPGVTTGELNRVGAKVLQRLGGRSAPMLVYGFPAEMCISVNDEIVHGIPGERVLQDGDLVKLDVTAEKDGYMADAALTVGVGTLRSSHAALLRCARRAFRRGLAAARAGRRVNEIGRAVEKEALRAGFSVVRELSGHGIGRTIHEAPSVPNYFEPRATELLTPGLVLTIEPLLTNGSGAAVEAADGWTVRTRDGSFAVHHEHTVVITHGEPLLLTAA